MSIPMAINNNDKLFMVVIVIKVVTVGVVVMVAITAVVFSLLSFIFLPP
jgi:hypothetical protein